MASSALALRSDDAAMRGDDDDVLSLGFDIGTRNLAVILMRVSRTSMHIERWEKIDVAAAAGSADINISDARVEELVDLYVDGLEPQLGDWVSVPLLGDEPQEQQEQEREQADDGSDAPDLGDDAAAAASPLHHRRHRHRRRRRRRYVDAIFIESQPLGMLAHNVKAKVLSHVLQGMLRTLQRKGVMPRVPITFVSPSLKLRGMLEAAEAAEAAEATDAGGDDDVAVIEDDDAAVAAADSASDAAETTTEGGDGGKGPTKQKKSHGYAANKRFGKESVQRLLDAEAAARPEDETAAGWATFFRKLKGKRDDYADVALQGYWASRDMLAARDKAAAKAAKAEERAAKAAAKEERAAARVAQAAAKAVAMAARPPKAKAVASPAAVSVGFDRVAPNGVAYARLPPAAAVGGKKRARASDDGDDSGGAAVRGGGAKRPKVLKPPSKAERRTAERARITVAMAEQLESALG